MACTDSSCVGAAASVRGTATTRVGIVHAASSAARRVNGGGARGGVSGGVGRCVRLNNS